MASQANSHEFSLYNEEVKNEGRPPRDFFMEHESNRTPSSRENLLAGSLVILGGGIFLFFLYVISLGVIGNMLAVAVAFVMLGALHYLVWGRSFSSEVAAEREAQRRQEAQLELPSPKTPSDAIQDIARTQGIHQK